MKTNDSNPKVEIVFEVNEYKKGFLVGQRNLTVSLKEILGEVGCEFESGDSPCFLLSYLDNKVIGWEARAYEIRLLQIRVGEITVWKRE